MNKKLTNNQKLNKARIEIDKIDAKLLPLIVKRSKMVNMALESKTKKSQIIDQKRIKSILTKVGRAAKLKSANPILIKSIWKSMIWNFIDYEKKEFKKKK
jgi:chorismate mutase|tara:strand:+ start:384 stop:683 length:300 start_codon:yes stop_codon:yes gene_type:complete